ncbi:MAG: P-loop NTPase [Hadesarchaea archaeon]|nr:P-loop NTPase [Hadesarchaea archaeon]
MVFQDGNVKRNDKRGQQIDIKPKRAQVIGVFSSKGGVGKTTTAVNLGASLKKRLGSDVLVVDGNFSAPNLGFHLGIANPSATIHDVLAGNVSIENAVQECEEGLHAILGSVAYDESIHLVDLDECLKPLKNKYKVIILDSSPGFGPEVISDIKACNRILVVTNPEIPTIASTLRTFRTAEKYKVPIEGVVLNRVAGKDYEISASKVREGLSWPLLSVIPEDDKVRESLSEGKPIVFNYPDSDVTKKFRKLADRVYEGLSD